MITSAFGGFPHSTPTADFVIAGISERRNDLPIDGEQVRDNVPQRDSNPAAPR
eukprot:CAMPEP_0117554240 /NCGR_PEP_ID=MMETSP0784-20121206/50653_1 /TAXON_ID=39447 /ORGANISM="" /LENGTH=52 /DNA_ID=CAMNT_0005351401 /DNA_START=145 /DNA_END=300 /DNA_ORIENTATION=-